MNRKTAYLFIVTVCLSVLIVIRIQAAEEYMTIQEFGRVHPEQAALAKEFTSLVQKEGHPIDPKAQKRAVRISFIYPGKQVSDYWRRSISSFRKRMDEIGIRYELSEHFSKPAVDYRMQEKQMRTALRDDPDYLVFTLDARKHRRVIERIITEGRPKLILQNITTPLRAWEGKQPFLYDGFDHATGSEILAGYYLERTRGEGNYAVLYHSQGYVSAMRGDTFIEYLKKHSEMTLTASYYTDANRKKSERAALEIIGENPNIRFIYACSTDIALGAIDALRQTGNIGKIMVNGWGGGSNELTAITKGEMDVTVMRMNDDNGVAMAEAIRLDIEDKAKKCLSFSPEILLWFRKGSAGTNLRN